jgi:glycosyltransferase involved in cell wall biosynthesis
VLTRAVFPLHGVGGLERHVFDLLRHHVRDGVRVLLVTRPPANPQALHDEAWRQLEAHPGLEVRFVPYRTFPLAGRRGTTVLDRSSAYPLFGWRAGRQVARVVAEGGLDVVYGLGASAWGYARARRQGAHAPLVLNPQGLEEFGGSDRSYGGSPFKRIGYAPLRRVVQACANAADAVIATDQALAPVVARHLHVTADRLRVVPNGIDLAQCDAMGGAADGLAVRQAERIGAADLVLLSVGRLERNKGFHVLADALAAWAGRPHWRWVVAGDGPFRSEIAAAVARNGIGSRVLWLGRVSDRRLHAWYEAADLFVHPTMYEGSSLVTLEAMAHRRPVVATRAGGLPDKVIDGVTGWLVPPGEAAPLAEALDRAVRARVHWPEMGRAGRALAASTFDWPVVARRLTDVYRELLAR